jgi:hypothetical protein
LQSIAIYAECAARITEFQRPRAAGKSLGAIAAEMGLTKTTVARIARETAA